MSLWPFQQDAVRNITQALRDGERPLCYAPTGAGKTRIAAEVFRQANGFSVFVVHTDQLKEQAKAVLEPFGVFVETIQTMIRDDVSEGLRAMYRSASLVCIDECHHLRGVSWRDVLGLFGERTPLFGLSATPYHSALDKLFTKRLLIATVESLIAQGVVTPVSILRPDPQFVRSLNKLDKIDGAAAYCNTPALRGLQAVHFEPTVALCKDALAKYEAAGVVAAVVTGKTPREVREMHLADFREQRLQVLVSPVLLTEGFDAPCAELLIAGRRFKSETLFQQAVGRVRRQYPGKTQGLVLDCSGCCSDRDASYFNRTDESMFGALQEYVPGGGTGAERPPVEPAGDLRWVECPAEMWTVEGALSSRIGDFDRAKVFDAQMLDAKRLKLREQYKRADAKRRGDPARLGAAREAYASRKAVETADDLAVGRQRYRQAKRRLMQDPAKRAARNAQRREALAHLMKDPVAYAAHLEKQRARSRAKKIAAGRDPDLDYRSERHRSVGRRS